MAFSLDNIVPWGRSGDEYRAMFSLTPADLRQRILGCGDGPAGFNAEMHQRGVRVISVDPLYACTHHQIAARIHATYPAVMAQVAANRGGFVWQAISSVEELGRMRWTAMETFLKDFAAGKRAGRYLAAALPSLPIADACFDLALSSHFLFLYSDHLSARFHLLAITEMLRVAAEVRLFPLLTLAGTTSPHLAEVIAQLRGAGFAVAVCMVDYEFQRGGNEMLVVNH